MSDKKKSIDFLQITKDAMEHTGFWVDRPRSSVIRAIEMGFVDDVLRSWMITDVVMNQGRVLLKWEKRVIPLTDQEIKAQYR